MSSWNNYRKSGSQTSYDLQRAIYDYQNDDGSTDDIDVGETSDSKLQSLSKRYDNARRREDSQLKDYYENVIKNFLGYDF